MTKYAKLWVLFALILMAFVACDSSNSTPAPPTNTPAPTNTITPTPTETAFPTSTPFFLPQSVADDPADQVNLRFVNAGMELPSLNIEIEGLALASGLSYAVGAFSAGIEAGSYEMVISYSEGTISEQPIELNGLDNLIIMFTGTVDAFNISIFDEAVEPLGEGQSRLNLIHAVPRGPNIKLRQNGLDLTNPLDFGQASSPVIVESGPATLLFQSGDETLYTLTTTLRDHLNYTYILIGDFNDRDTLDVISINNRVQGFTNLRIINASNEIGSVDVYFDDIQFTTDLAPTRTTTRQNLPSQTYQLSIYPTGDTDNPIINERFSAREDDNTTIILSGSPDDPRIITMDDDLTITPSDETRIRFVSVVPDVPTVGITVIGGEDFPGLSRLTYAQPSRTYNFPVGSYGFRWSLIENNEPAEVLETADELILEAGRTYVYLFTGQDDIPLIISEEVGFDETPVDTTEQLTETLVPTGPTRLRFVHAIDSAPLINVFFDELEIGSLLAFRQTLDFSIIPSGLHIVSIRDETNSQILGGVELEFLPDTDYSVFAYGNEIAGYEVIAVPDNVSLEANQAIVRLVHLSQSDNSTFTLNVVETGSANINLQPDPEETEDPTSTARPDLFFGTTTITAPIPYSEVSGFRLINPNTFDLIFVDQFGRIGGVLTNLTFDTLTAYDIIVYEDLFTREVRGFVLEYPSP